MPDKLRPDADVSFDKRLGAQGREAFETLCRGCDRNTLGGLFSLLAGPSQVRIESGREIHLRRLDVEHALKPMDFQGLARIVKKARDLIEDLGRLKQTTLVRHLRAQGAFQPGDLLSGAATRSLVPAAFRGLLELPDRAKEVSRTPKPDHDRLLRKIYKHIYGSTGEWRDALVADVLNALNPRPNASCNSDALKQWRWRNKLRSEDFLPIVPRI